MTRASIAVGVGLLATALAGSAAQAPPAPSAVAPSRAAADPAGLQAFVDSLFEIHMRNDRIPGAAFVLIRDGALALAREYGTADLARATPVEVNRTVFRIGSVTKVFTALALLRLVDRGRIELESPVRPYLDGPFFEPRFGAVRVEHLLTHSGGFDQTGMGRHAPSPAERPSLRAFLEDHLVQVRPPGIVGVYDTYGITLAGYLVEQLGGRPYAVQMRREVFEPLGMRRTFVETPDSLRADLAIGYGYEDGRHVPQEYEHYVTLPASSVDATAADMGRLLIALLGDGATDSGRLLRAETTRRVQSEPGLRYVQGMEAFAFGFWVERRNGRRALYHGGVMRGYSSQLYLVPSERLGFFFAYNRDPETGPPPRLRDAVTAALIDRLLPAEGPEPGPLANPITIDTRRFAGAYANTVGCFTCQEGEGWPVGHFRVTAPEPGLLQSGFRWVAVDSLQFQRADGSKLVFLEDSTAAIRYAVSGPDSFARLDERLLEEILGPGWEHRPPTPLVAIVYRANERWPEAARAYESLGGRYPDRGRLHFYAGFSRLNAGQPTRAIPSLGRALELGQWRGWSQYYIAIAGALATQGEREAALDALARALDLGFHDRSLLETDPWWRPLRDDPRFVELARRLEARR